MSAVIFFANLISSNHSYDLTFSIKKSIFTIPQIEIFNFLNELYASNLGGHIFHFHQIKAVGKKRIANKNDEKL